MPFIRSDFAYRLSTSVNVHELNNNISNTNNRICPPVYSNDPYYSRRREINNYITAENLREIINRNNNNINNIPDFEFSENNLINDNLSDYINEINQYPSNEGLRFVEQEDNNSDSIDNSTILPSYTNELHTDIANNINQNCNRIQRLGRNTSSNINPTFRRTSEGVLSRFSEEIQQWIELSPSDTQDCDWTHNNSTDTPPPTGVLYRRSPGLSVYSRLSSPSEVIPHRR